MTSTVFEVLSSFLMNGLHMCIPEAAKPRVKDAFLVGGQGIVDCVFLQFTNLKALKFFFHLVGNGSMEKETEFLDKCMMYLLKSMDDISEVCVIYLIAVFKPKASKVSARICPIHAKRFEVLIVVALLPLLHDIMM